MKNHIQKGEVITVVAPYAVMSGQGVKVVGLFGVAAFDAAIGTPVEIVRKGVFDLSALLSDTGLQGAKIFWDDSARRLTTAFVGNSLVGCLTAPKTGADATARVLLDGTTR